MLDSIGKKTYDVYECEGLRHNVERRSTMPTYEFICEKCSKPFTLTIKVSEYERKKFQCPKCKSGKVKQQITSFETITSKKS